MNESSIDVSDEVILQARSVRNDVDPSAPYAFLVEKECSKSGTVDDVATIFLTNRECPFRCLMCDLWKNTTIDRVPVGAIPTQIDHALSQLPAAQHIKLYNSGNFFDAQAIPKEDWVAIARRCRRFETVIVENHPKLCNEDCLRFRDLLETDLEIAIGLETIHPKVLARLNKQMTVDDFAGAVEFLTDQDISVRAFILLKPPFLSEEEGVEWALRSIDYAFSIGVDCCSVIPTRAGNGIMDRLQSDGLFTPPTLPSLERVQNQAIGRYTGKRRVFVDLWDVQRFSCCESCLQQRTERLHTMNLTQKVLPPVECECGTS